MTKYQNVKDELVRRPKVWLITGVAGFIGSNLLEHLLNLNQTVFGIDNFSTGYRSNLDEVKSTVSENQWSKFTFTEGDIRNLQDCQDLCNRVDYVLHQAALGSVPRSINDPIASNDSNINGFLNMLVASRDCNVKSFTYAASSSTYGDHPALPKVENNIGKPLSPYAVTKLVNELYADVFSKSYNFNSIGLRYFNVFGKRQNPNGAYAAVIPKWTSSIIQGDDIFINGDGSTSRDFCFVENAVQANLLAATAKNTSKNQIYNCAVGDRTTLNSLFDLIKNALIANGVDKIKSPIYREFRDGDVKHSQADISKAIKLLDYSPEWKIKDGINITMPWYISDLGSSSQTSSHK